MEGQLRNEGLPTRHCERILTNNIGAKQSLIRSTICNRHCEPHTTEATISAKQSLIRSAICNRHCEPHTTEATKARSNLPFVATTNSRLPRLSLTLIPTQAASQ